MNDKDLQDIKKKLGIDDEPAKSDIAFAMDQMTKQQSNILNAMLNMHADHERTLSAIVQQQTNLAAKAMDRLQAMFSPQALRLSSTLERAAAAAAGAKAHQVSPDDGRGGGPLDDDDDDDEERTHMKPVDEFRIIADSADAFSGSGFQPPNIPVRKG